MSSFLSVENLCLSYQEANPILNALDLLLEKGELCVLLGYSGSGKTSLLRFMAGLLASNSGNLYLDGRLLNKNGRVCLMPPRRGVFLLGPDAALFEALTVLQNIEYGLKRPALQRYKTHQLIDLLRLDTLLNRYPACLSQGERQRVALARAFATEPAVLLLDEVLSHLDLPIKSQIMKDLHFVFEKSATTVLWVTHQLQDAPILRADVGILSQGKIVQKGGLAQLYKKPRSIDVLMLTGKVDSFYWENKQYHTRPNCWQLCSENRGEHFFNVRVIQLKPSEKNSATHLPLSFYICQTAIGTYEVAHDSILPLELPYWLCLPRSSAWCFELKGSNI